jgi:GWxTD domain-containing protein
MSICDEVRMKKKATLLLPAVMIMALWAAVDAKAPKDPYNESFFEKTRLIMTKEEIDIYKHLTEDAAKENFIEDFWRMRDPFPDTEENEFKMEFERRIAIANRWFHDGLGRKRGWDSDRGRILLQLGEPDKRESRDMLYYPVDASTTVYGYDIWVYYSYHLYLEFADTGGGQFRLMNYPTELLSAIDSAKAHTTMGNKVDIKNLLKFDLSYKKGQLIITIPTKRISFQEKEGKVSAEFKITIFLYHNYQKKDIQKMTRQISDEKDKILALKEVEIAIPYQLKEKGKYYFEVVIEDSMTSSSYRDFLSHKL